MKRRRRKIISGNRTRILAGALLLGCGLAVPVCPVTGPENVAEAATVTATAMTETTVTGTAAAASVATTAAVTGTAAAASVATTAAVTRTAASASAAKSQPAGRWKKDRKGWWFAFDEGGYARNQWLTWKGEKYYFNAAGYMTVGWKKIKGKWYYFKNGGAMVCDRWIGRYYLNPYGVYTKCLEKGGEELAIRFRHRVYNAVEELEKLDQNWTSFLVLTDTHGSRNSQHSQAIVRYLLEHTEVTSCFWLGDIFTNWADEEEYKTYSSQLLPYKDRIYVTIGNHDRAEMLVYDANDVRMVYDDFLKDKAGLLKGNPEDYYYYMDDPAKKLRYLVLNTSNETGSQHRMSTAELQWLRETGLKLPSKKWSVVILGHEDIDTGTALPYTSKNGDEITKLIQGCNGHVVGYFCGHEHRDLQTRTAGGFVQTIITSDAVMRGQNNRKLDSTTEAAVTIVSVNTKTGEVRFHRIGTPDFGNLKTYNYLDTEDF